MLVALVCPLCGCPMSEEDGRYVCTGNHNHILSIENEVNRYYRGEKDKNWLQARMKVRLGKLIHRR